MDKHVQQTFDENYERTMARLQAASQKPDFSMETTKGELEALYRYEGLDWTGRGELKRAEIEGSILAYQAFIKRTEASDDSD